MLGNSINEFIEDLYHNPEKEIIYNGKHYMVTGYVDETGELYTLTVYTIEENNKTLFLLSSKIRYECVEAFEKAQIFDGKTIYEVEKDIEVLFG